MNPRIGKYILDSLSIGMYNHPLMLIREYIQNSADSIDIAVRSGSIKKEKAQIVIGIDGRARSLTISDNGIGIPAEEAEMVLHDIGRSTKKLAVNRGFRGIGRLGGLGYCDILRFVVKAKKDDIFSTSSWNCRELRQLIKDDNRLDTVDVIKTVTEFKQNKYQGNPEDHFFKVLMLNLNSSRDTLLNVPLIKTYLSEVGPVPYNHNKFSFADKIEQEIRKRSAKYETYNIIVNDDSIFKPYSDTVGIRGDKKDKIQDIKFFDLGDEKSLLAFGWVGKLGLLGSISEACQIGGIRVRDGNMLIGDKNLLNDFFRENRFNGYLVGELFTIDARLIPNSRRDDFEDNLQREEFYEDFIKTIGLPYSRQIRQNSLARNKQQAIDRDRTLIEQGQKIAKNGYLAEGHKRNIIEGLTRLKENDATIAFGDELISRVANSKHYLDGRGKNGNGRINNKIKAVSELIYKDYEDKEKAINLIKKIIDSWT